MLMASSFSTPPQVKYDVFLSFRGEDTRNNFTSHLHAALCRKGIETFIDNQLGRGDEISSSLLNTIKASKISIIVFSVNYAASRWCLQELEQILECQRTWSRIIIPIFYHVDPSHVRYQTGSFGDAFAKLQECFKERLGELKRWKVALEEAANLSGWPLRDDSLESVFIDAIAADISKRLHKVSRNKDLFGVESAIQEIESLLCIGSEGVCTVGIWGMGGIGKTTVGRVVFDKMLSKFDGCYFFENVREELEKNGLEHLKKEFLSEILKETQTNLGLTSMEERLGHMKVLIVFDDVTCSGQIEKLIRNLNNLGLGSRIIITSRDKQVLKNCGVCEAKICRINGLRDDDALRLFRRYAFGENLPIEDYVDLTKKLLKYAQGHPLALKVLGSSLFSKGKEIWESAVHKLEKGPPSGIYNVLKISYDGLEKEEQDIFLDIACFFKWDNINSVIEVLNACNFSTKYGISVLIDKHLITMSGSQISMHDLLEEMGKQIVQEESKNDLGKYSRLWNYKDAQQVLKKNKGTEVIQGIWLDLSKTEEINLNRRTFSKMCNLRFLDFCCSFTQLELRFTQLELSYSHNLFSCSCKGENSDIVRASQGLKFASIDLIYFCWHGYPLTSLPSKFNPTNLVALIMPYSKVKQLWRGVQNLDNLKHINLSYSKYLTEIPDLSEAPNLESLILEGCINLIEVPSSVQNHNKLSTLNLRDCKSLNSLPRRIDSKSLERVCLSGCSSLEIFPTFPSNIRFLDLSGTAIREFPLIEHPSRLIELNLEDCFRLKKSGCSKVGIQPAPLFSLNSLKFLSLGNCGIMELPSNLGQLCSLKKLYLQGNNFMSLPTSIKDLPQLRFLDLGNCKRLQYLPKFPYDIKVCAYNCISLEGLSESSNLFVIHNLANCFKFDQNRISEKVKNDLLRILQSGDEVFHWGAGLLCYPGNEIPKWFRFQTTGDFMTIARPPDWNNKNFRGLAVCTIVEFPDGFASEYLSVRCRIKAKRKDSDEADEAELEFGFVDAWLWRYLSFQGTGHKNFAIQNDHVFLAFDLSLQHLNEVLKTGYDDDVDLCYIKFDAQDQHSWRYKVKKCAIHFLHANDFGEAIEDIGRGFNFYEKEPKVKSTTSCNSKCNGKSSSLIWDLEQIPLPEELKTRTNQCSTSTVLNLNDIHHDIVESDVVIAATKRILVGYDGAASNGSGFVAAEPQSCWPSITADAQSSSFIWDLNEVPQDFIESTMEVIPTTKHSLGENDGTESSGTDCYKSEDNPQRPKRLKYFKFI